MQRTGRGAAVGAALVVAASAAFVAYYAWLTSSLAHLVAPLGGGGHAPRRAVNLLLALGAAQLPVGLALALLGARGDPRARRLYVAWLVLLASVAVSDRAAGTSFDSAAVAAAYGTGAAAACAAGWLLVGRRVAAA